MKDFKYLPDININTYGEPFHDSGYTLPEIEVGDGGSFITTNSGNRVKVCFKVTKIIELGENDQ